MGKALEGMHYCKKHQGNHSHYDEKNCAVCIMKTALESIARVQHGLDPTDDAEYRATYWANQALAYRSQAAAILAKVNEIER